MKGEKDVRKPEFYDVKMLGGPFDGQFERVPKEKKDDGTWTDPPHFFIAPYQPEPDEDGNPPSENIVGWMRGTLYIRPNYAYYQQVTDVEYFYVRDIDEDEISKIQHTGQLPDVVAKEDDE